MTRLVEQSGEDEKRILSEGRALLVELVSHDDWLPDAFAAADPERYRQNLLYCDPQERFAVVSFVWGPGQHTPVHDHTVWGMVGVLRGAEICEEFEQDTTSGELRAAGQHRMEEGQVDLVSPTIGDIHRVSNALEDILDAAVRGDTGDRLERISGQHYELADALGLDGRAL
ncbi:MAG: hypothetical protein R3179_03495, partial [Sedimenticolaceae bacterium]|nr:hypothetical protein [Sedimenticolaceae bacterium]